MPNLVPYSFTAIIDSDSSGANAAASQAVSVKNSYDGTLATIYEDAAGTTPIAQPGAQTDANGVLDFYVEAGRYRIESGSRAEEVVIDDGSRTILTEAEVATSKHLIVGDVVTITDRANSLWDVIAATTNNGYDVLDGTASSVSLRHRAEGEIFAEEYGVVGSGDESAGLQALLDSGKDILLDDKTYLANNLTQSTDYQRLRGLGNAIIQKNANGDLITSTGNYFEINGVSFRGDASSPVYTGHNIVLNGDHPRLINAGSRWAYGRAVYATGAHVQIIGTNDIYQTADSSSSGYDIEINKPTGSASLYHQIEGVYTSQAAGGILMVNTGTSSIRGGQFGKLTVQTGGSGTSSGLYVTSARINGDVTVLQNNFSIENCGISADVTIGDGVTTYSGISVSQSVDLQSGQTFTINDRIRNSSIETAQFNGVAVVNNLTDANDIDNQISIAPTSYTPTWTGATTNPTLGDGSLTATYSRSGTTYTVTIALGIGSTTNTGAGEWRFSLPATAGATYIGSARMLDSGTAFYVGASQTVGNEVRVYPNGAGSTVQASSPFTWATGDAMEITIVFDK